jgi:hypothetical protein
MAEFFPSWGWRTLLSGNWGTQEAVVRTPGQVVSPMDAIQTSASARRDSMAPGGLGPDCEQLAAELFSGPMYIGTPAASEVAGSNPAPASKPGQPAAATGLPSFFSPTAGDQVKGRRLTDSTLLIGDVE